MPEFEKIVFQFYNDCWSGKAEIGLDLKCLRPIGEVRPGRASPNKTEAEAKVKVKKVRVKKVKKVKVENVTKEKVVKMKKERVVKGQHKRERDDDDNERWGGLRRNTIFGRIGMYVDRKRLVWLDVYDVAEHGYGDGKDASSSISFDDSDVDDA